MSLNPQRDAEKKAMTRQRIVEAGFKVFSEKTIDAANLTDVSHVAGVNMTTVYRYYSTKKDLVLDASTWAWNTFILEYQSRGNPDDGTAAQIYEFFLDSFIDLYRSHRDLLRFNQFFNAYVQREAPKQLEPFQQVVADLALSFHKCYERAKDDHTLRTDIPEKEMFSKTLHLMLAAVTRYAVGLVYDAGIDPLDELLFLKNLLKKEYTLK